MSSKMAKKLILVDIIELKNKLKNLRKALDYRNIKFCKKQLDEVLKEFFGDI